MRKESDMSETRQFAKAVSKFSYFFYNSLFVNKHLVNYQVIFMPTFHKIVTGFVCNDV